MNTQSQRPRLMESTGRRWVATPRHELPCGTTHLQILGLAADQVREPELAPTAVKRASSNWPPARGLGW
jgi:hypothetical protein